MKASMNYNLNKSNKIFVRVFQYFACLPVVAVLFGLTLFSGLVSGQNTVSGAFEGIVSNSQTGDPIPAKIEITNEQTGAVYTPTVDSKGRFYQGLLAPGFYRISVSAAGLRPRLLRREIKVSLTGEVVPVPVALEPESAASSSVPASQAVLEEGDDIRVAINTKDARREGSFRDESITKNPLGSSTLTKSFDELALLLPGVAPPPQTVGEVAGPGVGAGVGSAGQFAVNGLRSRGNNFTVDGSDNNDEDIGVRRQGFIALIAQPIESVKEFQIITLLSPAQFGRNIGAQVNAVSKSGGNDLHGALYGFFNSNRLNARNFFDTTKGSAQFQLREGNQAVFVQRLALPANFENLFYNNPLTNLEPLTARSGSGGEDESTLGQFGFVLGGPLGRSRGTGAKNRLFYFVSAEGQTLNATRETSFAVPSVAQRGVFNTGLTGLFQRPSINQRSGEALIARNFTAEGSAILSLFPFPNDADGIYGANTFTQTLPAGARGVIASGKLDGNFTLRGRPQTATARYNFTDDRRDIPVTGGAVFSSLRSRVRTQNLSTFLNGEVTDRVFNQIRISYGRTRLDFDELRDTEYLLPGGSGLIDEATGNRRQFTNPADNRFLLNAPFRVNVTRAVAPGIPNTGAVVFSEFPAVSTERLIGPVGQVKIGGFSPLGVDVFNFPQQRVNNTYQAADTLTLRRGSHNFTFGTDIRRSELNSDLPRNSRPLISFNGIPYLNIDPRGTVPADIPITFAGFINPIDQAGTGAASSVLQTLATTDSAVNLRFYQLNFFGQDEWRIRPNLSLSYGLRYEYNTPPSETSERIENTFNSPLLDTPGVTGLKTFIAGRSKIFDPDRNNFAPRVSIAYSPALFENRITVIRGGFGIFYDQIIGSVVSQSRNVFPNFLTINTGGGEGSLTGGTFGIINPSSDQLCTMINPISLECESRSLAVNLATLNQLNPTLSFERLVRANSSLFRGGFGATLPARQLNTPQAYHYNFTFEQQLSQNLTVSAAYVGTQGRNLLRFTTPNLGENVTLLAYNDSGGGQIPTGLGFLCDNPPICSQVYTSFRGTIAAPGSRIILGIRTRVGEREPFTTGGRPVADVGAVNIYESTASSRYDALQMQARGRFRESLQFQIAYTFSKVTDDVSDVFDLAGAAALPQNSFTFEGERAAANFDARHRFSYSFIYGLPSFSDRSRFLRNVFGGFEIAGTGKFQTGQPFTVNSIFDVNLDGNLTDRPDTTQGIEITGDRRQPLRLTANNPFSLLAPIGEDGSVERNSFRAGNVLELDLSVIRQFSINDRRLSFRADIFNIINRANFGIPVRFLEAPGFGKSTGTITPGRRVQLSVKYEF